MSSTETVVLGEIRLLPVGGGDCVHIRFKGSDEGFHNVIIDGGPPLGYLLALRKTLLQIQRQKEGVDLLIVTHIDDDHIGGILEWFADPTMPKTILKEIWFNSGNQISQWLGGKPLPKREVLFEENTDKPREVSIQQGRTLEGYLRNNFLWNSVPILAGKTHALAGANIQVLSPNGSRLEALNKKWQVEIDNEATIPVGLKQSMSKPLKAYLGSVYKRDRSIPNGSSITVLFELGGFRALLAADAHSEVLEEALETMGATAESPIQIDVVKVSHHGSRHNTSPRLLSLIECSLFAFSTDGFKHSHPDMETVARILQSQKARQQEIELVFNYKTPDVLGVLSPADKVKYNFQIRSPRKSQEPISILIHERSSAPPHH